MQYVQLKSLESLNFTESEQHGGNLFTDTATKTCSILDNAISKVKNTLFGQSDVAASPVLTSSIKFSEQTNARLTETKQRLTETFNNTKDPNEKIKKYADELQRFIATCNESTCPEQFEHVLNFITLGLKENKDKVVQVLNNQSNVNKDTVCHMILKNNRIPEVVKTKLIDKCVERGADLGLKNDAGDSITATETKTDVAPAVPPVPTVPTASVQEILSARLSDAKSVLEPKLSATKSALEPKLSELQASAQQKFSDIQKSAQQKFSDIQQSVQQQMSAQQQKSVVPPFIPTSPQQPIATQSAAVAAGGSLNTEVNTEAFIEGLVNKYSNTQSQTAPKLSEQYVNSVINKYSTNSLTGGNQFEEVVNTDTYLNSLMSKHLSGGSNGSIEGSRKLNQYSDYMTTTMEGGARKSSKGKSKSKKHAKVSRKFSTDLSRLVNNQANEIMKNVIGLLKETVAKGDEELARDYKAALWHMVKEKFPNETNLNQVIELEKMAKDSKVLKSVDLKKAKEWREESRKRSEERRSSRKSSKKSVKPASSKASSRESTISATSEGGFTDRSFSATSYSANSSSVKNYNPF